MIYLARGSPCGCCSANYTYSWCPSWDCWRRAPPGPGPGPSWPSGDRCRRRNHQGPCGWPWWHRGFPEGCGETRYAGQGDDGVCTHRAQQILQPGRCKNDRMRTKVLYWKLGMECLLIWSTSLKKRTFVFTSVWGNSYNEVQCICANWQLLEITFSPFYHNSKLHRIILRSRLPSPLQIHPKTLIHQTFFLSFGCLKKLQEQPWKFLLTRSIQATTFFHSVSKFLSETDSHLFPGQLDTCPVLR